MVSMGGGGGGSRGTHGTSMKDHSLQPAQNL